jgi:cytochrome oxidase Cu insertion factor (SCO1/SenC/PrrC family)
MAGASTADTRARPDRAAPAARPSRGPRRSTLLGALGVALALVLAAVLFSGIHSSGPKDPAPHITPAGASLLDLNVLNGANQVPTTDFTLVNQYGRPTSLDQFKGKAVILSFNDDQCPDLCTLLAQSIVVANRDLGRAARHVVFLSVNVNPFYPEVSAVRSWTKSHGLAGERNWVFTTGSPAQLEKVWQDYGTYVHLDQASKTVQHSTQMFFINPQGKDQAVASFGSNAANTSLFAHDMAQMAVDLLPASQQVAVGGPPTPSASQSDAAVGAHAPSFSLPVLGAPARTFSSASLRGRYAVVNFWSSTCTACVQELPHVEQAAKDLGNQVAFVGIDVADAPGAGRAFARRAGVTYQLASDSSGSVAGAYQISGLPFTVILGPRGTLLIRHPGSLTTEQLTYILEDLDQALPTG